MKKTAFLLILLTFFSCKSSSEKKNFLEINKEFQEILKNFLTKKSCYSYNGQYASLNVTFYPYREDTLVSIACLGAPLNAATQLMHYDSIWFQNFIKDKRNIKYFENKPDGVFLFKLNKLKRNIPIIFYNIELYNKKIKKQLIKRIPDSLLGVNGIIWHSFNKDYIYKNGKFIKIKFKATEGYQSNKIPFQIVKE